MATVTGLTADRMLAIEAASVVDGDVDSNGNLILTQHGGGQINAGSVIGPMGPQGPVGSMLSVITAQPVLDIGVINQIRAGRQLSPADFGNIGLSAPIGLWNLSDLSDSSGNGRALTNKGAVGFASGINGAANTSAQFIGSVGQALYIPDGGAGDPFRIHAGTIGCWVRSPKKATTQTIMSRWALNSAFTLQIVNEVGWCTANDGVGSYAVPGASIITDNRWHFVVVTFDDTFMNLYVDSVFENRAAFGVFSGLASELNIGNQNANASSNGVSPLFGCVDEAFMTADVLSEDQIRNLYCAKIPHTNGTAPARFTMNVRRRRRGAALASSDFPTQPLRLYNFSSGSLGDEGSNAVALTNSGATVISGADGTNGNAYYFGGQNLASTDAGLPSALNSRSYGCWFKTTISGAGVIPGIMGWGAGSTSGCGAQIGTTAGSIYTQNGTAAAIVGPFVADGVWHHVVVVENNGAIDSIKRRLYLDGRLVGSDTALVAITLGGANRFRIGAYPDLGGAAWNGNVDGVFICDYALTAEQISMLYDKSLVTLSPSPKNPGDHIEGADANNLYTIFDTLDSNYQVDLKVAS
jgi:hypothetical protein